MKRSLAFMLVMVMLLCLLPSTAFASTTVTREGTYTKVSVKWPDAWVSIPRNVTAQIYLDGKLVEEHDVSGKGTSAKLTLTIKDGYKYAYEYENGGASTQDPRAEIEGGTITLQNLASAGLSEGSREAVYSTSELIFHKTNANIKLYLTTRGSKASNHNNVITDYRYINEIRKHRHGFTHKVFEDRTDINFTYGVERIWGSISNINAAKLNLYLRTLQDTGNSEPDDVAYAWDMYGIDSKYTDITLQSDKYWFYVPCFKGQGGYYGGSWVYDNVGPGQNQVRFGSTAVKKLGKAEDLPGYNIYAFPLEIPLTKIESGDLCTVKQVNKATDGSTNDHGIDVRFVKVFLNGQHKADADNTVQEKTNGILFPNRGDNMKASDIDVTNTPLGNQYHREIVVKENDKTYEIHYYNYIYELNLNANGGSVNPAQMTSDHAVPDRSYTFSNLPTPTRAGYDFLGWADSQADADNGKVSYNAGDSLTLNYTNGTDGQSGVTEKTIYAVWKATEVETKAITLKYDGNGTDVSGVPGSQTNHVTSDETTTFKISDAKPSRAGYKFLGWAANKNATAADYTAGVDYTVSTSNTEYTLYGIWEKLSISYDELKGLIGDISVSCVSEGAHEPKTTQLINGSYSESQEGDTLTVTIKADEYVNFYNEQVKEKTHRVYGETEKIVVLKYDHTKDAWEVESGKPVEFRVTCAEDIPQPPVDPDKDIWNGNDLVVKVHCETGGHDDKEYPLLKGHFDLSTKDPNGNDITSSNPWKGKDGKYYCYININNAAYCDTYSKETDIGAEHELCDPTAEGERYQLIYEERDVEGGGKGGKWKLVGKTTIPTINVRHDTTIPGSVSAVTKTRLKAVPEGVTLPEDVTINKEETVTFTDNNTSATLLYEFTVKGTAGTEVTIADSGAKFFNPNNTTVDNSIEVTIGEDGTATVYGYKTFTKDNIQEGNLNNTATATNKDKPDDNATGSSDVPAEYKPTEITGEVKNVEKKRILAVPAGVTLPENVTINKEETVIFTDNNLDATLLYAFTVTGTPGAEVVIKDTGATFIDDNGKPVNDEITVTLPVAGENEAETSTTVYGYRTFSVDDIQNGKLVNNATANVEGDGKTEHDEEKVDAEDNRTLKNTLTVKKLVSGNAANTKEEFPFKATFTFPVPVASPTQDGVTYGETVEINFELAHDQTRTFSYTSDAELKTKIDKWMEEYKAYGLYTGDNVFAMLRYKVEETDTKGYTLATSDNAEGNAAGHNTVTFTNTKNKPNDDHGGHYHPTTTPVPVIVIPPKTGDMPFWYSIAQFLGLVK